MPVCGVLLMLLLFAPPEDNLADALKALDAHQPAVAEPLLRKAIAADPNDYAAHFNLALALSLQQKDAEAIPELRKTLELKPGLYEADLNLGILLLRNKMPAEALPQFGREPLCGGCQSMSTEVAQRRPAMSGNTRQLEIKHALEQTRADAWLRRSPLITW